MDIIGQITGLGFSARTPLGLDQAAVALLMSFILGQVTAWMYVYTHAGLSYSRSFVQSIILLTCIVSLALMVIGSNIVIAFGLLGALTVIRFRNILKDTRDTAFIFMALVTGMATGTGSLSLAILGTLAFCAVLLYLHWASFGSRDTSDGFLRFQMQTDETSSGALREVIERYCRSFWLVSQRFQVAGTGEVAYRLTMRDPTRADHFVSDLRELDGISKITFVMHEDQGEV